MYPYMTPCTFHLDVFECAILSYSSYYPILSYNSCFPHLVLQQLLSQQKQNSTTSISQEYQTQKLSASGQEIGGDLVFGRRLGFSGTPSDLIPVECGRCQFEEGDDGKIIATLTSPAVVNFIVMDRWSPHGLLDHIATSTEPRFNALIDTGALITGMSNLQV